MKTITIFKLSVFFSELETIILKKLFWLNLILVFLFFMPFFSIRDNGEILNLFESSWNFFNILSNNKWYYFFSLFCSFVMLLQPIFFLLGILFFYFTSKNYTQSILVNLFIDDIKKERIVSYYALNFLIFHLLTFVGISIGLSVWIIIYLIKLFNSIQNDWTTPNFGFFVSIITIIYYLYTLRKETLRKFNFSVFEQLVFETLQDVIEDEYKKSEVYRNFIQLKEELLQTMKKIHDFLTEVGKVVNKLEITESPLIRKFNFFEQAFEDIYFLLRGAKKGTAIQFPIKFYDSKSNKQILSFTSGAINVNETIQKKYIINKQKLENLRVELFSTSKWLLFTKYIENEEIFNISMNPSLIQNIKNGDLIKDSLYVIQYTNPEQIVTQKIPATLFIKQKASKIKLSAIIATLTTLFGYFFWIESKFPWFLSFNNDYIYENSSIVQILMFLIYVAGLIVSYRIITQFFISRPVSYLKSLFIGLSISFSVIGMITVVKNKFGNHRQALYSAKVYTKSTANIREKPNKTSRIIYQLKSNDELKIESKKGEWYKVYYGEGFNQSGYIYHLLIKPDSTMK